MDKKNKEPPLTVEEMCEILGADGSEKVLDPIGSGLFTILGKYFSENKKTKEN